MRRRGLSPRLLFVFRLRREWRTVKKFGGAEFASTALTAESFLRKIQITPRSWAVAARVGATFGLSVKATASWNMPSGFGALTVGSST